MGNTGHLPKSHLSDKVRELKSCFSTWGRLRMWYVLGRCEYCDCLWLHMTIVLNHINDLIVGGAPVEKNTSIEIWHKWYEQAPAKNGVRHWIVVGNHKIFPHDWSVQLEPHSQHVPQVQLFSPDRQIGLLFTVITWYSMTVSSAFLLDRLRHNCTKIVWF